MRLAGPNEFSVMERESQTCAEVHITSTHLGEQCELSFAFDSFEVEHRLHDETQCKFTSPITCLNAIFFHEGITVLQQFFREIKQFSRNTHTA